MADVARVPDQGPYGGVPTRRGSATSADAAASVAESVPTLRECVFKFLEGRGTGGATDEEIAEGVRLPGNTARPRRCELVLLNRIHNSGERRPTRQGRYAVVWRAGPPATPRRATDQCPVCHGKGRIPRRPPGPVKLTQTTLFEAGG